MGILSHIFGLGLQKWIRDANPDPEVIGKLLTCDDRWITLKSGEEEEGGKAKGRRVLLRGGKIVGGNVPKEAQGMNVQEWGERAGEIMGTEGGEKEIGSNLEKKNKLVRFETGKALSPEQKKEVLRSIGDAYKDNDAPRELKYIDDRTGEEVWGYQYSPDSMYVSDITGKKIRHYISLPDGRKAHPTELFPNLKQSEVDNALAENKQRERFSKERLGELKKRADGAKNLNEVNMRFNRSNKSASIERIAHETVVLQDESGNMIRVWRDLDEPLLRGNGFTDRKKESPTEPEATPEPEVKTLTSEPFESTVSPKGESHATSGNGRGISSYSTTENEIRDAEKSFSKALNRPIKQVLRRPDGEPTESHRRAQEFVERSGIKRFVFYDTSDPQMTFVGGMMDHNSGTLYLNAGPHIPHEGEAGHEVTHFIARTNPELYKQLVKDISPHVKGYSEYKKSLNDTRAEHGLNPLPDRWVKDEYFATVMGELVAPGSSWPDDHVKPSDLIGDFDKAKEIADKFFDDNARNPGQYKPKAPAKESKKVDYQLDDNQDIMLREALAELDSSEMQGKTRIEGIGVRNYGSTYPKWFKDNRFSSATVRPAIAKALLGEKLVKSQADTIKTILSAKERQWDQQYGDIWRIKESNEAPFSLHKLGN